LFSSACSPANAAPQAGQVVALEPGFGNILIRVLTEGGGGRPRGIDRVDDDRLGRANGPEPLGEIAEIQDLQQPAAVRVELSLDRIEASLLDPVLDAVVRGQIVGGLQVQMPALVRLARRIVDLLGSDDACGVVDRQVHRQDVADCGLSDQALLRRNAHAHL
jgi:hypothetical protein